MSGNYEKNQFVANSTFFNLQLAIKFGCYKIKKDPEAVVVQYNKMYTSCPR